jgi:hypothetical protein
MLAGPGIAQANDLDPVVLAKEHILAPVALHLGSRGAKKGRRGLRPAARDQNQWQKAHGTAHHHLPPGFARDPTAPKHAPPFCGFGGNQPAPDKVNSR